MFYEGAGIGHSSSRCSSSLVFTQVLFLGPLLVFTPRAWLAAKRLGLLSAMAPW